MSKSEEPKIVYEFMLSKNQPTSLNDMTVYLQTSHKLGKTAIQRALDTLVVEQKIIEKAYGKQKIFWVNQSVLSESNQQQLSDMDKKVSELESQVQSEVAKMKSLTAELNLLSAVLTTADAKQKSDELSKRLEILKVKEGELSVAELPDPTKIAAIKENLKNNRLRYQGMKRRGTEMIKTMMENYPHSEKTLREEIGIEDDGF